MQNRKDDFTRPFCNRPRLEDAALACPAQRWLWNTLDTVGGWFCRLSGNAPGQGIEKDPAGVRQDSPGRKPWDLWQVRMSALNGRCRPLRLFPVGILGVHVARARALACPARPFQGRLHTVNGPQPGMPAKYMTIGMDRGRLLTVRPLRLIRRSLGTITRRLATVSRVGNSQRTAGRSESALGVGVGIGVGIAIGSRLI